jgi:hypothetical protein
VINCKEYESKQFWACFMVVSQHLSEETEENYKTLSKDNQPLDENQS